MPQVIEVPGYGDVEFPDGMSDAQMEDAIRRNMSKPDGGRAARYAQWIVANKDKQGTPEFETVAKAYRLSRSPTQPASRVGTQFTFTSPDGKTYDVDGPEGATQEQAFAILQQSIGGAQPAQQEQPEPNGEPTGASRLPPGFVLDNPPPDDGNSGTAPHEPDSGLKRRLRGFTQATVAPAAQLMSRAGRAVGHATNDFLGLPRSQFIEELPQRADMFAEELREDARRGKPEGIDWQALAGQAAGTFPLNSLRVAQGATKLPGLINRAAQGATTGGALAPTNEGSVGENVGTSTALSVALPPILSRIVNPVANQAVRMLADRGVKLTPGQIMGPTAKRIEDAARSIPLVGDAITAAQRRSFASFNQAVINDALAPIGGKVQGAGREAVEAAQQQISNAYETLLPQLRIAADGPFIQQMQAIRQMSQALPPELQPRFNHIVQTEVLTKFTPQGRMSGETMKAVESQLGQLWRGLARSNDVYERQMAGGVRELQAILRGVVERSNPQHSGQLKAINQSYARMDRVNNAASRVTSEDGIFTPEAFSGAVKAGDKSKGKRAFAAGHALSQELSDAARSVMGNRVPDSGTARRLLTGGGLAGGAAMIEPNALAFGAIGAAPYLPGIESVVRNALLRRPPSAARLANALSRPSTAQVALPAANALLYGGN